MSEFPEGRPFRPMLLAFKVAKAAVRRVKTTVDTVRLRALFALNGISAGRRLTANGVPSVNVSFGGRAVFGRSVTIRVGIAATEVGAVGGRIRVGPRGLLRVGDRVGMSNATIVCEEAVSIGDRVLIGGGTQIFDTDFHSADADVRRTARVSRIGAKTAPVIIGNDVFIGTNVLVCKGVSIGEKAVVAAGSVVVKSVPSGEIWGGNPARRIK